MGKNTGFLPWIKWQTIEWNRDTAGLSNQVLGAYMRLAAAARNIEEQRGTLVARLATLAMHMRMEPEEAADALAVMADTQRPDGAPLVALAERTGETWQEVTTVNKTATFRVCVAWVRDAEREEAIKNAKKAENMRNRREQQKCTLQHASKRSGTLKHVKAHIGTCALEVNRIEENRVDINTPHTPRGGGSGWFDDTFWPAYPKKVAKEAARKAAAKVLAAGADPAEVMAGLEAARASEQWTRDGGRYVPHPATWLNGRRWEDEAIAADDGEGSKKPKNAAAYNWPPEGMMYE